MMTFIPLQLDTSSGRHLPFELGISKLTFDKVVCDKDITMEQCRKCKMFNHRGGCPPASPSFDNKYRDKYKHIYLLMFKIPLSDWMSEKVAGLPNVSHQFLYGSGFVEAVIKSFEKNLVKILREQGGTLLPSSYCTICQKCVAPVSGCAYPQDRMFSPESLGVLVNDTLKRHGLEELEWFRYGDKTATLPEYIRKVVFFMSDDKLDVSEMLCRVLSLKNISQPEG